MLEGRLKLKHSAKCGNALYLYSLYFAIHDLDWHKIPDSKKDEFKAYTKKLRSSGKFES